MIRGLFVRLALLLLAAVLPLRASGQQAPMPERRVALVVGIATYQHAPALANPVNDARAISGALRRLNYEALPLDLFMGEVSLAKRLGIVLLDSCRNNPFVERLSRSMTIAGRGSSSQGLARVDNVPRNTMVVMATKADQIAEDGGGDHSP